MKKILVGVDHSPRTSEVVGAAIELASRMGAKLVLFRAVTVPTDPLPDDYTIAPAEYGNVLQKRALVDLEETAKTIPPHLLIQCEAELGIPWEAICRKAKAGEADCIIIGSHGYGAIDRLIGTTAAKVVNHADRSVLVVRAPSRIAA